MENIIINLKGENNLVISSKINKTDKKELEKYINRSWRLVNIKFKDKKDSIEYKLFLLSLTDKHLRKEYSERFRKEVSKKNEEISKKNEKLAEDKKIILEEKIILDENKIEIKIKNESKEFYEIQESDLERINKYDDWMKDEILEGLNFNRETGLTLEKVNSFLRLKLTEQTIKNKIDEAIAELGFIK